MGYMKDGVWHEGDPGASGDDGSFQRKASAFRSFVTADGAPGPTGEGGFKAEAGRYHLYVSLACPWAHRALVMRRRKGLTDAIGLSVVHWYMGKDGWSFADGEGVIPDPIHNADFLREVYAAADPNYTGRVTVPVLWDKERGTIVSNESAEIIRMFDDAFEAVGAAPGTHRPDDLTDAIDEVNARVYDTVNNGVYKAGFASAQKPYEAAVTGLFDSLDWLETLLDGRRYLMGDTLTEADIRLYTTLVRFDPVYHTHFKCNLKRIVDYPNLWRYLQALYSGAEFRETTDIRHIKRHYYESHPSVNPKGIVPVGSSPLFDREAA